MTHYQGLLLSGGSIDLDPGQSDNSTLTASYTLTQADIDNGGVSNQATATGDSPTGTDDVSDISDDNSNTGDDTTTTTFGQNPSIALIKTGVFKDENEDGFAQVGETIDYTFTVTNTGNVTVSNITISDPLPGITLSGGSIDLDPGAFDDSTLTATYTLTQADIDNGGVSNQATATGDSPTGTDDVSDTSDDNSNTGDDTTTTTFGQNPSIALIKTGVFKDENEDGFAQVGETIDYTFTVTNTGNVSC